MGVAPGRTSDPQTRHQARTRIRRWNRAMLRRGTPFARRLVPLRSDGGFAVPTVLFMLLAAFAVASVGAVASISSQRGVVRDQDTKEALTAAEAGVSQALLH